MSYGYTHVPPQPASNQPTEQSLLILYHAHLDSSINSQQFSKFSLPFRTTFALHSTFSCSSLAISI